MFTTKIQWRYLNLTAMRKREPTDAKRAPQPFFKYVQPAKTHIRSMMELEPTARYSARLPTHPNKENHHASLNHELQPDTHKPNSLKKFLSIFAMPKTGRTDRTQERSHERSHSQKQVFTCQIKSGRAGLDASRSGEKEEGRGLLVLKNKKVESNELLLLKKQYEEALTREGKLQRQVQQLQAELEATLEQRRIFEEKGNLRERELQRKIEQLQRSAGRERCKEHELIIESLKKVINEQLRKIIELEKSKVEREEIEKLEERINLNITRSNLPITLPTTLPASLSQRKQANVSCSLEDSRISEDGPGMSIQQATEEEQESFRQQSYREGDSILQEVDRYLKEWRRR